jgi:hypothetical protein
MYEVSLFYDETCKEKVTNKKIQFEPARAGTKTEEKLYVRNNTKEDIRATFNIESSDRDVSLETSTINLGPYKTKPIKIILNPKLSRTEAIDVDFKISIRYAIY